MPPPLRNRIKKVTAEPTAQDRYAIIESKRDAFNIIKRSGISPHIAEQIYQRAIREIKLDGGAGKSEIEVHRMVLHGLQTGKIKFSKPSFRRKN